MAGSPAHVLGEAIGLVLEEAVRPLLQQLADECGLYLDAKGERSCRSGKAVAWQDKFGNTHDLDFVLEAGGTDVELGRPIAFIECAWRRYTKHSRNKAQEIQGAVGPLAETYNRERPFLGAVLAGDFTEGAKTQLVSHGFAVVHFPYETVVAAFGEVGIDIAYDEATPTKALARKAASWNGLSPSKRRTLVRRIAAILLSDHDGEVNRFLAGIRATAARRVRSVRVLPLHGKPFDARTLAEAAHFIDTYAPTGGHLPMCRYEITVEFSNGDRVSGEFERKTDAIDFLDLIGARFPE